MRKLRKEFDELNAQLPDNFVLAGLPPPVLHLWTEREIEARSRDAMAAFASENKIEVISIPPDHADRAWRRYFDAGPPFNPGEERKERRKDIPDSWIFEAAIDVKGKHPGLLALCGDGRLTDALRSLEIRVFRETRQVLDEIERSLSAEPAPEEAPALAAVRSHTDAVPEVLEDGLEVALEGARETFRHLDRRVLGYVGYLGSPTKDQLFGLLSRSGIGIEVARNVAERLAITGILTDTGNHYLPRNKEASQLAAISVEAEIIKLLKS